MTTHKPSHRIPAQEVDADPPAPVAVSGIAANAALPTILDNLDALVYVADFETHEMLYMNAYWQNNNLGDYWAGKKCWQVLQNADGPCSFCTNHLLIDSSGNATGIHVWEFQNKVDKRWYQCRDQAIRWTDGRLVRLEIATDITERKNMEVALQAAQQAAEKASLQDELTLLNNRRALFQFGEQIIKQARRSQTPVAAIMFDLDHFKHINDTYGHEAGDAVLREVGTMLRSRVRGSDVAARIGGEEFALLLPDTQQNQALELAELLRQALHALKIPHKHTELRPTASFGIAMLADDDGRLEALLSRADEAMYLSKTKGRDNVSLYPQF